MESNEWVKSWLKLCEEQTLKPWKFDFKQFYMTELMTSKNSHLKLWLDYKRGALEEPQSNTFTTSLAVTERDPDKVASAIYDELGWPNDEKVNGDSMNSFKTTFTRTIMATPKPQRIQIKKKLVLMRTLFWTNNM